MEYCQISKANQSHRRAKKAIPFSKIGNFIRYDRLKIDKWIEEHEIVS